LVVAFWLRRVFRIYPLSVLFILLMVGFHIPADPNLTYRWIGVKGFLSNLALVQNLTASRNVLAPLWTLPLEMQMYVVLPFAYFALRGKRRYLSGVLWVLAVVAGIFLPPIYWRLGIALWAPCFASGIVAFDLLRHRTMVSRKLPAWWWPIGIFLAILIFHPVGGVDIKVHKLWVLTLALALLYVHVKDDEGGRFRHRFHRVAHWIAEHSYGIYLSHVVLIWFVLVRMSGAPVWVRVLVFGVSSIAVPALLHRYVERPMMLVGAHLSRRILHPRIPRSQMPV